MAGGVERIEIYVDGAKEPTDVLTEPPYKLRLDTHQLADGEHTLRLVTLFRGGRRAEQTKSFTVDNLPRIVIDGLEAEIPLQGMIEADVNLVGARGAPGSRRPRIWPYALTTVVVLGGIWLLFVLIAPAPKQLSEAAPAASASSASAPASASAVAPPSSAAPVNQTLLADGSSLYSQHCSPCHGANGEGVPGAFPPLAHNASLADATFVIRVMHDGKSGPVTVMGQTYNGQMPGFASLSAREAAAIATFVRNDLGNAYGGVSERQVSSIVSAAAAPPLGTALDAGAEAVSDGGALLEEGKNVYAQNCAACHGDQGQGRAGLYAPLAHNPNLKDVNLVIGAVLVGKTGPVTVEGNTYTVGMPSFGLLSNEQIAAVVSYVRGEFGNRFAPVSPDHVEKQR